jgi:hypothetical protein
MKLQTRFAAEKPFFVLRYVSINWRLLGEIKLFGNFFLPRFVLFFMFTVRWGSGELIKPERTFQLGS